MSPALSKTAGPVRRPGKNPAVGAGRHEGTATMTDTTATGRARPLRFGVVAPLTTDLPTWRDQVRRIADSGYSTLLMPDVPHWQPAPGPTVAVAAALADLGWARGCMPPRCACRGARHGKRTRCRCSPMVASRWELAPAGPGSKTHSANCDCPTSHRA